MSVFGVYGAGTSGALSIHNPGHCPIAHNLGLALITSHIHMSGEVISAHSLHHLPPPHSDAPWVNSPILFTSGHLRGKWIRAELVVQQQPRRGRKGAIHDLRPLHPPPTVRLKLWEIIHPVPRSSIIPSSSPETLYFHSNPIPPPPNAQVVAVPIVPRLTTHFLCFASLFKVHPPTREQEYGRVDRKVMVGLPEGPVTEDLHYMSSLLPPGEVIERPKSDKDRAWKAIRPHPMTAISCRDPQWSAAVTEAWARLEDDNGKPNSPIDLEFDINQDSARDIDAVEGDLSFREMHLLEPYLPREAPKWVYPYQDVTAHLSKRETAGHLIPSIENAEPAFYFVFSDLAIRNEGYFSLRFHIVNLDWRVHPQFTRPGTGFFSPLCDCVTTPFAVYSTKEFPGLPPTTEFTGYLVRNGVRIRFRDDRGVDAAVGEPKGRGEGRARTARKNSTKSSTQLSLDSTGLQDGAGEASNMVNPFSGRDNDGSRKEALLAASQVWRNSPGGGNFLPTFDADELGNETRDITISPVSPRHRTGRSHTISAMRGTASPSHSPPFQDRRSYSSPTLELSFRHSSNPDRTMISQERQYAQTSAPGVSRPAIQRPNPIPSPHDYMLKQDSTIHPSEQRWSSISPHSPHTSMPSPGYAGQGKLIEDEMDQRFSGMSTSGGPIHQQSPIMTRERLNHRYYPYPPATISHPQHQFHSSDQGVTVASPLSAGPPSSGGYQYPSSHTRQTFDGKS